MASVDIDSKAVQVNLKKLESKLDSATEKALEETANEALRLTQIEVPHDEGTLQNSGVVEKVGQDIVLGYHTPYAARLHEHPEFRFQRGRKGKYIEDPINRNRASLGFNTSKSFENKWFGRL